MWQMIKIRLVMIILGTISMKWVPREPVAWSVICHTKTIWLLMTGGITVFAFPRPDLSAKFGQPNACNNCHSDQSFEWAANAIDRIKGPVRQKEARHPEAFYSYR